MNAQRKETWKTVLQFLVSVLTALLVSIGTTQAMTLLA